MVKCRTCGSLLEHSGWDCDLAKPILKCENCAIRYVPVRIGKQVELQELSEIQKYKCDCGWEGTDPVIVYKEYGDKEVEGEYCPKCGKAVDVVEVMTVYMLNDLSELQDGRCPFCGVEIDTKFERELKEVGCRCGITFLLVYDRTGRIVDAWWWKI